MEYGMIVYVVTVVLAVFLGLAGIYFLVYKWHINRAIKDSEGAKKSKIHLPSLGLSYTGMWFLVWIVSAVVTLMMIMDVLYITRRSGTYAESNADMLNYIEERVIGNEEKIDEIYDEMMNDRYVSEKNTKFELGNFDAEKNTIDLRVSVSDINMSEGDTVKWRMNGRTVDLTQDMAKKTYTGVINMDIMEFDVDYTLDSVFISEVDGIKRVDRIYKYNRYYDDSMFDIDDEDTFPEDYHYLSEGDFGEYWENYFPVVDVTLEYDDGYDVSYENGKLNFDEDVYLYFDKETKAKGRKIVSGKVVFYISGKKVYEQKADINKVYNTTDGEETYTVHINKIFDMKDESTVDFMFEYEDNYGYTYSKRIWTQESPFENTSMDDYVIKNKNGDIIYIQKAE